VARRVARLKRDHPAEAVRLEAGEYKSVAAAEQAAPLQSARLPSQVTSCSFSMANA
jgi:hypothetical protein